MTCIVLLRKGEDTLPALKDVEAKVQQLNDPDSGRLLPGTKIKPYYDRTDLLHITTETVTENLCLGVALVISILFMFVNNIRTAIIVAINIPLALFFAFSMLYVRGKSANLLSIGAVDFGIIVDSSVVVVENIYRNLASGNHPDLPIKERILIFVKEIDHALLYSTLIMVCAFRTAVCHDRTRGAALWPHGTNLRVLLGRGIVTGSDTLPCALCAALEARQAGPGEPAGPKFESSLPEKPRTLSQVSQDHMCTSGVPHRRHCLLDPTAGT